MAPRPGRHDHQRPQNSAAKKRIAGIIQLTRKGVGYLPWPVEDAELEHHRRKEIASAKSAGIAKDAKADIEIAPEYLNGALNGDLVEVEVVGLFPRPKGTVVAVTERAKTEFVGTLKQGAGGWVVLASDIKFYRPIQIARLPEGAKAEDRVLIKLLSFSGGKDPEGEIIEIIGTAGDHRTEMNAIVLEHGFSTTFPPEVLCEAKEVEKNHAATIAAEASKRADYRNVVTMTIDPFDAKDFDDALSVKTLDNGDFEVGVHIADATYFVRPGTALDDEATKRGTSVYLVDATIPMLPLELSGNVCSLREGEDRLAFSATFRITPDGRVLDRRFEKSIIRSNKRFTYEEAQAVLDQHDGKNITGGVASKKFEKELLILRGLARILRKGREQSGAIDFGDNEVKFVLDEKGVPVDVVRKERIETNLLIEEFMLLANREVATYVTKLAEKVPEHGLVFLYRIHDKPKEDRIEELATFVRAIGYEFGKIQKKNGAPNKSHYSARDIGKLLAQIEGKPEEHLIRTATLRSMAKAIYSTKNIGHFGLAFDYYTHFTSPIRRYPDMLVHRILASHLPDRQTGLPGNPISRREYSNLEKMCLTASEQEAKAVSAERDSIRYKQVEYLLARVGQEFDAVISGVTDWGLYVEDTKSASEGLVRVRALGDDFYNYDPKSYALVGQRTQKKHALGDRVRVKLVAADLAARTADFELVR